MRWVIIISVQRAKKNGGMTQKTGNVHCVEETSFRFISTKNKSLHRLPAIQAIK
ncbi:hypothetical protein [Candidatus Enterococcus mansonii]|uniref:Uncharacterized protein n=1 Tax=Candidatus Enterococcus mansonii TaxID=1834181 RepID=A0A242CH70_9ENTE|nr:hypothetical protein A5880_000273 [Enterococcus sp. 4G2_DIV0659]